MKKIDSIDGLKGLGACIIAFMWHYQHFGIAGASSPFYQLFKVSYDSGWVMVELFFLLSGFCMTRAYGKRIANGEISFAAYMKRRVLKIYPLFLLSTLIVLGLQFLYRSANGGSTFVYQNFDVYHFVLNILLMQNGILETGWSFNAPSWCICICIWLYMLLYLVCKKAKKDKTFYSTFAVFAAVGCALILWDPNYPVLNSQIGRGLAGFSAGVLLYGLQERLQDRTGKKIAAVGLCLLAAAYVLMRLNLSTCFGNLSLVWIFILAPAALLCALYLPWIRSILSWKPIVYLGKISIGIYLLHFPVQLLIAVCNTTGHMDINFAGKVTWIIYAGIVLLAATFYFLAVQQRRMKRN